MQFAAGRSDPELSLRSVRLENSNGRAYAIASNRKIMAVEFLNETDQPDGAVNITVDPLFVHLIEHHMDDRHSLEIEYWPEFNISTATIGGEVCTTALRMPDTYEPFRNWRGQFPTWLPKVDKGFVWFETEQLSNLGASSPSGMIALPEVLDNTRRVIVRDIHDPNWCGVFIPFNPDQPNVKPATIPEWLL